MGKKQKKTTDRTDRPLLKRIEVETGIVCLVVCDPATGKANQAFLDYCSHKEIPLGPEAEITKKGRIRCPHHDVCFNCASGAVTDDNGKKVPVGLIPVEFEISNGTENETKKLNEMITLTITPEHKAYLSKHLHRLEKRDKSRKNSTTTRRKEQNNAGDINKTNNAT